ncbi:MAG TPA: hypothetical protein PKY13_00390 [Microthrixaceae bacterium]|nr:hypothetical protein [Microthrixaceae bacterium]
MLVIAMVMLTGACEPQPVGPPSVTSTRPRCPFDDGIVIYGGDSLVTQWPRWVPLPPELTPYNTARGGSAYTGNLTPDPDYGTIGSRILDDLDDCGNDVGAVVISGGHVDLSYGRSAEAVIESIGELDEALHARGVEAVFLEITPVSNAADWYTVHQVARQTINAWMATPGNLHGAVVDCSPVLETTPASDVLAPRYWNFIDAFGTIDLVHPNDAAYEAIGTCVQPAILAAVER